MATRVFVDQENGELHATKSQLKLPSGSSKALAERTKVNTPLPKKAISTSPVTSCSVRKALGNVNKTKGATSKLLKPKQENQPCTVIKTELESCHTGAEEDWPEIEKMFPLDPQDFDRYELPEEDKLSNINLCGVPLMVFERTYDRYVNRPSYDSCVDVASPWKIEKSWESNLIRSTADFLATLNEIIEMPPPLYDEPSPLYDD